MGLSCWKHIPWQPLCKQKMSRYVHEHRTIAVLLLRKAASLRGTSKALPHQFLYLWLWAPIKLPSHFLSWNNNDHLRIFNYQPLSVSHPDTFPMVGSLWKGEWFIWTLRLGKGTKNARHSYFQALFLESAGRRRHILCSATAVMDQLPVAWQAEEISAPQTCSRSIIMSLRNQTRWPLGKDGELGSQRSAHRSRLYFPTHIYQQWRWSFSYLFITALFLQLI